MYSNVIPTGEEDTTKLKKVTITSSKREKNKTKKKHKQKKAAKLHVSPGCQPTSRWGPPLPPAPPPRFPCVSCESNTLQSPPSELRALVPRSLTHSLLEICRKTRFEASRVVLWSLSCYKELRLTTNRFTGRRLHGLLIQMQNISL